jgi:hypothetical protein
MWGVHAVRREEVPDEVGDGRNRCVLVHDDANARVYIELYGNHDGVSVHTAVRLSRAKFRELVTRLGVL